MRNFFNSCNKERGTSEACGDWKHSFSKSKIRKWIEKKIYYAIRKNKIVHTFANGNKKCPQSPSRSIDI